MSTRFRQRGLTEACVLTLPGNQGAPRLHRAFGFGRDLVTRDLVTLEKKPDAAAPCGAAAASGEGA